MSNRLAPLPITKLLSQEMLAKAVGLRDGASITITGLTEDSRDVKEGVAFAAVKGEKTDGHAFIERSVEGGAAFIILSDATQAPSNVPYLCVESPRAVLGQMAAKLYAASPKHIAAVTGTNGKTSVVHFYQQLWEALGQDAASIGTLGMMGPRGEYLSEGTMTTPGVVPLHEALVALKEKGIDHVALEASSHGLSQDRLAGVQVQVAGFTNLTQDHLDYHGTMEAYLVAKQLLFTDVLAKGGVAVVNADDAHATALAKVINARGQRLITYGKAGETIAVKSVEKRPDGLDAVIAINGQMYNMALPLVGEFQLYNVLCAVGMCLAEGAEAQALVQACATLKGVPGRLERIAHAGASYFVDYAHTPDALERVLEVLKDHVHEDGRLIVVFGCGGDRDKGKRKLMGQAAATLADVVIVTDDNPRTEDAGTIRKQVLEGCPDAKEVADRKAAIEEAANMAGDNDSVLVAGKGHEAYQIIGEEKQHFSDKETLLGAMAS